MLVCKTYVIELNNAKNTNFFTKFFINYWCGKWLLVNKKVILIVGLNEN